MQISISKNLRLAKLSLNRSKNLTSRTKHMEKKKNKHLLQKMMLSELLTRLSPDWELISAYVRQRTQSGAKIERDQWHSIVIEQWFRWTDTDGRCLCIWSTMSRTRRLREKDRFFSFVERESRASGVSSISSEFRNIVCVFNACVSMCVLNVLIRDQRANLCAKWNIYAWQLDTSEQRDYWDMISR